MDAYVGCMYYRTNEFDLCHEQQKAFEKSHTPRTNFHVCASSPSDDSDRFQVSISFNPSDFTLRKIIRVSAPSRIWISCFRHGR
ncbi:NADH dehydrogenase [ubiquinone] 1 alpha subcomplex subunit 8-A [Acorus gramineus]|uniref:NADH dehydrogenase [ubiquinone] 1 alpha subcomplex subunit 8-A n=1 Tax=Acorus gramineus TaxID=55184 RepID=A0AAV9A1E5_ACOGR|nr:NADH dehydrogenase [ubiquinone] 1 alpha subcomplex subunit 8-A [Acorus gramineus]